MNTTLWKLDSIGERLWSTAFTTATIAAILGNKGRGMAIVAEETRRLANHVKNVVEQIMEGEKEINSEEMITYAEQLNYLAFNTAIEAARLWTDGKQAAVCAEEIRNLAYALSCLFNNDLAKKNVPDITPWAAKPMTTTSQGEFLLLDIGGIPVVEPFKNIVEIMVTGYTKMERQQGSIQARNMVIPLADGFKLLGKPIEAKTYVIIDTPWAEQNNRYAVATQEVSCIFSSPIGNPITVPKNMPLAKYVRECWENENGEPFYFMDWAKMSQ